MTFPLTIPIRGPGPSGGSGIPDGRSIIYPFTGNPSSGLNLNTNIGPNALLKSASYLLPSQMSGAGNPLFQVPVPNTFNGWRIDNGGPQYTMPNFWQSGPTTVYQYNNNPANLGGIIPAGGMLIDGFSYSAGTVVFQFMDFSLGAGGVNMLDGGPTSVVFRACRARGPYGSGSVGWLNNTSVQWTGATACHYCDTGGPDSTTANACQFGIAINGGKNQRIYRCYTSYIADGFQTNLQAAGYMDIIENGCDKLCLFLPTTQHLDCWQTNGNSPNARLLRNSFIVPANDEQGGAVVQTSCGAFFQDFGGFPGSGTNPDGSTGYVVSGNYVAGTGFPFYLGVGSGGAAVCFNFNVNGNFMSTQEYPNGGFNGPVDTPILFNGTNGCVKSNNVWTDGPNAGQQFF